MEVINVQNVKIPSINQKYGVNRKTGRLFLNRDYRLFKEALSLVCSKKMLPSPYKVLIEIENYGDIDNQIKLIQDSLQGNCIDNDNNIYELIVRKTPLKRGKCGSIKVFVESLHSIPETA